MPDFQDDEHKAIEAKYDDLRQLIATIGSGDKPLRAVQPQLLVTATGGEDVSEVTAALVVALEKGVNVLEALTNLETSLRIAVFGVHANVACDSVHLIDIGVSGVSEEEEHTLAEVMSGLDGDADTGGRVH